jgi:hypothetical protein
VTAAANDPRRVRGDLRFLRIYVLTTLRITQYRPHAESLAASETPADIADRVEDGLVGEAWRYRAMGWCILGLLLSLPLLAGFLWSGMYWLPVRIYWWPFERGNYGLPWLSLFEWLCYLVLALYFVVTGGLLSISHDQTSRLGTEYRRLLEAPVQERQPIADAVADTNHPRTEFVMRKSKVFSAYADAFARVDAS